MIDLHDLLQKGANDFGVSLAPGQLQQFDQYTRLLLDWNQRVNLTAITEPTEVVRRHYLDSLACSLALRPVVRAGAPTTVIDVGAGAGFPGLPLKIAWPALTVTLLEATQKKDRFLDAVIADLGLTRTAVIWGRAEDLARRPAYRAHYDYVVARALAPLATLVQLCLPLLRVGGRLIAPKKVGTDSEIRTARSAIAQLGGDLGEPMGYRIPGVDEDRLLIIIDKARPTPRAYPRLNRLPAKEPL